MGCMFKLKRNMSLKKHECRNRFAVVAEYSGEKVVLGEECRYMVGFPVNFTTRLSARCYLERVALTCSNPND